MDSSVSLLFSNGTSPQPPPIPSLPYCRPEDDFLLLVSSQLRACVPTYPALASTLLGFLSIGSWLFAQLPQIVTNYRLKSTEGLSFLFLLNWCFGDSANFTGAVLLDQMTFQKVVAAYYVMVDIVLVGQFIWYSKKDAAGAMYYDHSGAGTGTIVVRRTDSGSDGGSDDVASLKKNNRSKLLLTLSLLFTSSHALPVAVGPIGILSSSSSSAGTVGATEWLDDGAKVRIGRVVAWMSATLYLSSRAPQIYLNYRRKSVEGLSWLLFAAAFCGNLFYSTSLLCNPSAWRDIEPHGEGGWVGENGSDMAAWWKDTLPFMLGAAGVLGMDGCVGLQFWLWSGNDNGSNGTTTVTERVVVEVPEDDDGLDIEVRGRPHAGGDRAWSRFVGINISNNSSTAGKEKPQKGEGWFGGSTAATPTNYDESTSLLVPHRLPFRRGGSGGVGGLGDIDGDTVYGSTSSAGALMEAELGKGCKGKGVGSP